MRQIQISNGQKKYIALMAGLTLLGIFFLSLDPSADDQEKPAALPVQNEARGDETARRLERILAQVEGAGKVAVEISYLSDGETTYAANRQTRRQNNGDTVSEEEEQTVAFYSNGQGNEAALVIEKTQPKPAGVLIVAQGADDEQIRRDLIKAAAALFDLPEYKITVLKMKGGSGDDLVD